MQRPGHAHGDADADARCDDGADAVAAAERGLGPRRERRPDKHAREVVARACPGRNHDPEGDVQAGVGGDGDCRRQTVDPAARADATARGAGG